MDFENLRTKIASVHSSYSFAARNFRKEAKELKRAKRQAVVAEKAQKIVQQIVKGVQESVHQQICGVVTRCLNAVFPGDHTFNIIFETKRGKTEARPVFISNGHEVNPKKAASGGMKEVAAYALRVAAIKLKRPATDQVIWMDEPFLGIWSGYTDLLRELIVQLSKELHIQTVLVTHNHDLQCGKIVQIQKKKR